MRLYKINANLIQVIENLYNKVASAVYLNGDIDDLFRTTVGFRQGCLLSPTLFNIFLERIMTDALDDHQGPVSIGGRTIANLHFSDDVDGLAGKEEELASLVDRLDKTSAAFGMEISAEKTKLMTNNANGISIHIRINGEKLYEVDRFKYLCAVVTDQGSKPEVLSGIAQTTAAQVRLKTIWSDKRISLSSKIRLMCSLVISVLLYACKTWTLTANILKKLQATEMRCFRKLFGISYRDHITNEAVRDRIRQAIGPHDDILTTVKKRKLKWFGHVSRSSGLAKMILQGTVQGGRKRGQQKKGWENNIAEWTGLKFCDAVREAENKIKWRERVATSVAAQRSLTTG